MSGFKCEAYVTHFFKQARVGRHGQGRGGPDGGLGPAVEQRVAAGSDDRDLRDLAAGQHTDPNHTRQAPGQAQPVKPTRNGLDNQAGILRQRGLILPRPLFGFELRL